MRELTDGLPSKSEKIRRLGQAGYSRQQIADFLGIRYQHVRNVLVDAEKKRATGAAGVGAFAEPRREWRSESPASDHRGKIRVQPDGSVVIPASLMALAGFSPGDPVVVHGEDEGEIHLLSRRAALSRAQEIVRQFVPEGVGLVEELLTERRREVAKEEREFEEFRNKRHD